MRSKLLLVTLATSVAGVSCDLPTDPPIIEQRWVLPLDQITLSGDSLLPDGVTVAGSVFDIDNVAPVSASQVLGSLCAACAPFQGMTIPVPAFQATYSAVEPLPTDVEAFTTVSGAVDITLTNGLSFDPLAGGGSVTITLADTAGGPVIGQLVFDGASDALAPGSVTTRPLVVTNGAVTGALEATIDVSNAGGQFATIDLTNALSVTASTTSLLISSVTATVDGLSATLDPVDLDVEGLDPEVTDWIVEGSAILDVTNPFGASFAGSLTIGTVTKPVFFSDAPVSSDTITFTGNELRSFLGQPNVTLTGSGTIGGGPIVLTPNLDLLIESTIDLLLEIG
jgi:hypothetical protein